MEEKVSIIVPIYNVEKYLKACLEKIINQTYKNIEIILVNDGSTDNSLNICKQYINDSRIKIINKKNGGLSEARNYGIDAATGKYLVFIDSDDIISIDFVEIMLNALKKENAEIACCRFIRFKKEEEIKEGEIINIKKINSRDFLKNVLYQHDQTLYSVSAWAKIYKREIFEKIRYPVGKLFEDLAVIADITREAHNIVCVDSIKYFYRINNNSITTKKFNIKNLDVIENCNIILNKVKQDRELEKAAESVLYSRTMELLVNMRRAQYNDKNLENKLWETVKKYRQDILKDKNTRKIAKICAVLSYFGRNVVISLNSYYKKLKYKMNIQ